METLIFQWSGSRGPGPATRPIGQGCPRISKDILHEPLLYEGCAGVRCLRRVGKTRERTRLCGTPCARARASVRPNARTRVRVDVESQATCSHTRRGDAPGQARKSRDSERAAVAARWSRPNSADWEPAAEAAGARRGQQGKISPVRTMSSQSYWSRLGIYLRGYNHSKEGEMFVVFCPWARLPGPPVRGGLPPAAPSNLPTASY